MTMTTGAEALRTPPSLAAAALDGYAASYGRSVLDLDRALADAPGPADLIDLTHGDTRAFVPPEAAAADFRAAVEVNTEAYTPYRGSSSLRSVIAPRVASLLGRPVDAASELIVTPGTQGGLFAALSALISPGDVVALPDPEYFMSERIIAYLGAIAHRLPVSQDPAGLLSIAPEALAAAAGADLLVLSHPNNPTGGVYTAQTAHALAAMVISGNMLAVVDQLYCRLVFDGTAYVHLSALPGMAERTVTLVGPSKTESMSGYRLGVAVGPAPIVDAMERVVSLASLRTAGYAQQALRHWMDGDAGWLADRIKAHQVLRDDLVGRLAAIPGVTVAAPAGSSYVFPEVSAAAGGGTNDHTIAVALKAGGVLVSPGYQFGPAGRGRFRINFSQDADRLALACTRIEAVLTALFSGQHGPGRAWLRTALADPGDQVNLHVDSIAEPHARNRGPGRPGRPEDVGEHRIHLREHGLVSKVDASLDHPVQAAAGPREYRAQVAEGLPCLRADSGDHSAGRRIDAELARAINHPAEHYGMYVGTGRRPEAGHDQAAQLRSH
jgi:aspartate/methionine/tyrosine aminotransferase